MILLRPLAKFSECFIWLVIVLPFLAVSFFLDWCDEIWARLTA
jgi:hypothetical protein